MFPGFTENLPVSMGLSATGKGPWLDAIWAQTDWSAVDSNGYFKPKFLSYTVQVVTKKARAVQTPHLGGL